MYYYLTIVAELLTLFFTSKYLIQAMYGIFHVVFRQGHAAAICVFILFFPGVIIHELAHLLAAEALLVRTGEFEVAPRIEGSSLRMGSVQVAKTDIFRGAIIGVAPVIFGTVVLVVILSFFVKTVALASLFSSVTNITIGAVVLWAVFIITNTMFSSKKDVEGVAELGIAIVFILVISAITLTILKIDFLPQVLSFFETPQLLEGVKMIALLLAVPVVLNLLALFVSRFFLKKLY